MQNPWEIPPFPSKGDDSEDITYSGVGRVLTQWELIELELSHLYAIFQHRPNDLSAIQEYGARTIFEERIKGLVSKSEIYFCQNPNQATEGEFCKIIILTRNFSARRNDIAHGVVRPFRWTFPQTLKDADPFELQQFCVTPSHYTGKKFDPKNMPLYVYTSIEMNALSVALFNLNLQIHSFKFKISLGENF